MKKIILCIVLASCVSVGDVQHHLGEGAVCDAINGICLFQGKQFMCVTRAVGCHQEVSCAEIVPETLK